MASRGKVGTVLILVAVVGGMAGLSFAAVPLYNLFCRVTGFGGTTQVDTTGGGREVLDRHMTIRFNSDIVDALPWTFEPEQRSVDVRIGENALAYFRAESHASATTTGNATFNVTPAKAGQYFVKLACFCFTEQTLAPGEETEMAVSFYVDPAIADDPNLDDVSTITLSYTFFPKPGDGMTQSSLLAPSSGSSYN